MKLLAIVLMLLLVALPARAAESPGIELAPGDAVSEHGAFFSGPAAIGLLEALRDLEAARSKTDALLKELGSREQEITEHKAASSALEAARQQTAIALAKAEFIIENWELIQRAMLSIIEEHKKVGAELRALNEQTMAALKDARSELWWTRIFSAIPILGTAALLFVGK